MAMSSTILKRVGSVTQVATKEVESSLTTMFQEHLVANGVDPKESERCRVVHDPVSQRYTAHLTEKVQALDLGTEDQAPMGLTAQFFNRVDAPSMFRSALVSASKQDGLI